MFVYTEGQRLPLYYWDSILVFFATVTGFRRMAHSFQIECIAHEKVIVLITFA